MAVTENMVYNISIQDNTEKAAKKMEQFAKTVIELNKQIRTAAEIYKTLKSDLNFQLKSFNY